MPPRKKAAKAAGQRSPTAQSKDSGDSSDHDPLPQILAKALAGNTELRNQLLAQLDLVPRNSIQQKDLTLSPKSRQLSREKMDILQRHNQSSREKAKSSSA